MTTDNKLEHAYHLGQNTMGFDSYTTAEWMKIADAQSRSGWDFYPDQWTPAQRWLAIEHGLAPDWHDNEAPKHPWTIDPTIGNVTGRADLLCEYLDRNGPTDAGWDLFIRDDRGEIEADDEAGVYDNDIDAIRAARRYLREIR